MVSRGFDRIIPPNKVGRFNEYLLRRAEESGIPVGQIVIVDSIWEQGDEAVMAAIRKQIEGIIASKEPPTKQLPDPEV